MIKSKIMIKRAFSRTWSVERTVEILALMVLPGNATDMNVHPTLPVTADQSL